MDNSLRLKQGQRYVVTKAFVDYDKIVHPIGEEWIYLGTNFLPYEDGLTLHVVEGGVSRDYRLQWRSEQQAKIIENFNTYVAKG